MNGSNDGIDAALRPARIIVAAMTAGMMAFGVLAVLFARPVALAASARTVLIAVLFVLPISGYVTHALIHRNIIGRLRERYAQEPPSAELAARFARDTTPVTIIGAALAEAFGLFGLVVVMITGLYPVLLAPALAVLALLLQIPTRAKLAKLVSAVTGQTWY